MSMRAPNTPKLSRKSFVRLGFTHPITTNNISLCSSMNDLYVCKVSAGKTPWLKSYLRSRNPIIPDSKSRIETANFIVLGITFDILDQISSEKFWVYLHFNTDILSYRTSGKDEYKYHNWNCSNHSRNQGGYCLGHNFWYTWPNHFLKIVCLSTFQYGFLELLNSLKRYVQISLQGINKIYTFAPTNYVGVSLFTTPAYYTEA